jgi:hypothetical protein
MEGKGRKTTCLNTAGIADLIFSTCLSLHLTMNDIENKEPGYSLGVDVDGSDSFDTITALVAEGSSNTVLADRTLQN